MKLTGLRVRSWAALGTYVGGLGALLGPMLAVLGRSWALMDGLEPLLGPLCPVLGCSWSLCWRSWAALGPYVGGLGPLLGPKLAVLAALGASEGGLGTGSWRKAAQTRKSEPNPSGSRVPKGAGPHEASEAPRALRSHYLFFL